MDSHWLLGAPQHIQIIVLCITSTGTLIPHPNPSHPCPLHQGQHWVWHLDAITCKIRSVIAKSVLLQSISHNGQCCRELMKEQDVSGHHRIPSKNVVGLSEQKLKWHAMGHFTLKHFEKGNNLSVAFKILGGHGCYLSNSGHKLSSNYINIYNIFIRSVSRTGPTL